MTDFTKPRLPFSSMHRTPTYGSCIPALTLFPDLVPAQNGAEDISLLFWTLPLSALLLSLDPSSHHSKRLLVSQDLSSPHALLCPIPTLPESGSRGDFGVHLNPSSSMGGPEGTGGDPLTPSSAMRAPSRPSRGGGGPRGESKRQQGDGTCGVTPPSWGERWFLGCARLRRRPRWRPQSFQWNVSEVLFE